jgi:hypothetical protein
VHSGTNLCQDKFIVEQFIVTTSKMAYDFNINSFSKTFFNKTFTTGNCANSHLMYLIDLSLTLIELNCMMNLRPFCFCPLLKYRSALNHFSCLIDFKINHCNIIFYLGSVVDVIIYSWSYNYQCNQCLLSLMLWVRIPLMERYTRYNSMW